MTINEIHRMVVAANPVPDPEMLEPVPMPDLLDESEGRNDMAGTRQSRTEERSAAPSPRRTRRAWRWSAVTAGLVATAVIAGIALVGPGSSEEGLIAGEPPGVLDEYVAALQANDVEKAVGLVHEDLIPEFTAFLVGTDTSTLQVSDCETIDFGPGWVRCRADFGPNWYFSRIMGEELSGTLTIIVYDDGLDLSAFPPPAGVYQADAEFEEWVLKTYPERYDEMFDDIGGIKESYESGLARSELVDEYLSTRG